MTTAIPCEICGRDTVAVVVGDHTYQCHEGLDRDVSNLGSICGVPVVMCLDCVERHARHRHLFRAACPLHAQPFRENSR